MTAGKGIVHSEMPEQENGLLEGFQLWINLPAESKMTTPAYQEHDQEHIPVEARGDAQVRVISGKTSLGTVGPVSQPLTEPLYLDVSLPANTAFSESLPETHNAFVYVINGKLSLNDERGEKRKISRDQLAVLTQGESIELCSLEDARFLLVAGKPLDEPIARGGPFVMNTESEIRQAFSDYQSGNF